MVARITREKSARYQVIVPWQRGEQTTDVVAAEITAVDAAITIAMLGGRPLTFPLERAKLFVAALQDAIAAVEASK